ncbi:MAG: hypothetical protein GY812_17195 [Actinomycetia bacterium]|nr:hypothetical protein [Actinomycetes bacterium]
MEQPGQQWAPPDAPVVPQVPPSGRFVSSSPLGGTPAVAEQPPKQSMARDLVVAAVLLVASVVTALASLMSWRDFGPGLNPDENGWRYADGSFGRGWVAILIAVCLAVGGVLLVMGRRKLGRRWARVGSAALIVLPVLEWALGDTNSRTGPGMGIWVLTMAGIVLMVLLGTVLPQNDPDDAAR